MTFLLLVFILGNSCKHLNFLAQVLEEKNALLGPGLATNYWFSYLKWICTGLFNSVLVENTSNVKL